MTVTETSAELTRQEIEGTGCLLLTGIIILACVAVGLAAAALVLPVAAVIKWVFS